MTERRLKTDHKAGVAAPYGSHQGPRRAVDHASDEGSPVERPSIAGEDLSIGQTVERQGYVLASRQGAGADALVGVFFGTLGLIEPPVPATIPTLMGLLFGAVLLSHALSGGRGSSSAGAIRAGRYGVVAYGGDLRGRAS